MLTFFIQWPYLCAPNIVYTLNLESKITFKLKFSLSLEHIFNTTSKYFRILSSICLKKKPPEFT